MVNVLQQVFNFYFRGLFFSYMPLISEAALNGVILGKDARQLDDGDHICLGTIEYTFFMQAGR